ncbi:hypothetical protein V495_02959 [Pseudogymnoascus sp. VKM F-4514 (FW-929)]|nr:hypothetical protein V495_02959 [Pseudogymnoascus sp. VKM F-4514 (FW-929)]KFY54704.1 hypothetical protein V497_07482 [Pseudogymnoascus sp. VKM F-4516 (FW-969)]
MAIDDPSKLLSENKRFFDNDATTLLKLGDPKEYLIQSASRIVRDCPPKLPWASLFRGEVHRGFFVGPTAISYFFWTLSIKHADLEIEGRLPLDWCKAYIELGQDTVPRLLDVSCGITNVFLTSNAVKACLYQDESRAMEVIDALRNLETDPTYCEWLKGRAGALYILRIIRQWLPNLATAVNEVIALLIEDILPQQPWSWSDRKYIGSVHGDIGILTQIVLSDPSYAPKLESKLLELLNLQGEEGNWPVIEGKEIGLVQFCHGAPGVLISLFPIRQYFPALHEQIDKAIALGRKVTWERGILTKEPNICHGITGNALVLDGPQKEHFLCLATPEKVEKGIADGVFEKDADPFGLLWGEAGRAWVWMEVCDGSEGKLVLYSDV